MSINTVSNIYSLENIDEFCNALNASNGFALKSLSNCKDLTKLKVIFLADRHFHLKALEANSSVFDALAQKGIFLVEGVDQAAPKLSDGERSMVSRVIDLKLIEAKGFSLQGWDKKGELEGMYQINFQLLSLIAEDFFQSLQMGNFSEYRFRRYIIERKEKVSSQANILPDYQNYLSEWQAELQRHDPFDPQKCTPEIVSAYLTFMHLKCLSSAIYKVYYAYLMARVKLRDTTMAEKIQRVVSDPAVTQVFVLAGRNHLLTQITPPKLNPLLEEMLDREKLNYAVFYQDLERSDFVPATGKTITNLDSIHRLNDALIVLDKYFDTFKKDK
jgi:hypothetical protein